MFKQTCGGRSQVEVRRRGRGGHEGPRGLWPRGIVDPRPGGLLLLLVVVVGLVVEKLQCHLIEAAHKLVLNVFAVQGK